MYHGNKIKIFKTTKCTAWDGYTVCVVSEHTAWAVSNKPTVLSTKRAAVIRLWRSFSQQAVNPRPPLVLGVLGNQFQPTPAETDSRKRFEKAPHHQEKRTLPGLCRSLSRHRGRGSTISSRRPLREDGQSVSSLRDHQREVKRDREFPERAFPIFASETKLSSRKRQSVRANP